MNQVKFLKGKRKNLHKQPLAPGTIYFTEDERRLYIDVETERIPIAGDSTCGKVFWVRLEGGESAWLNNQQIINSYYENIEDVSRNPLGDILSPDSIIFIGKSTFGTAENNGVYPAIIAKESDGNSIVFQIYNADSTSVYPDAPLWIQIYCPNPKFKAYVSMDVIKSVFTTRVRLDADQWNTSNRSYTISIDGINFSEMPYLINLSDSSLENRPEFLKLTIEEDINGNLVFRVPLEDNISIPNFNIEVDLCIIIARGVDLTTSNVLNSNNEWVKVHIDNNQKSVIVPLNNIPQDQERFLLSYCPVKNEDYANVESITYNNGILSFNFKENVGVENGFDCTVIQLNNISTIHQGILRGGKVEANPQGTIDGWQNYSTNTPNVVSEKTKTYYSQIWPSSTDETHILKGVHLPIVIPTNEEDTFNFSKLIETKMYNNGKKKLQFISKDIIEKDLPITVIDFI